MSMKQIAKEAGVSVATVSKAFGYSKEISEGTRQKIFRIARKQGVFEKYAAEKFPRKVIAVICPEIQGGFYTGLLQTLQDKITQRGGVLTISMTGFDENRKRELYEYHTKYQKADGVILLSTAPLDFNNLQVPTVFMASTENKIVDAVTTGMIDALEDAVRMCKQNGHEKLAFIGETRTACKQEHFAKAVEKEGLWVYRDMIITSDMRYEDAGRQGVERLLAAGNMPDAILTGYDQIAIGAIQCLEAHGLSVPEDVSVIGMNDIEACTYLPAPLTTIKLDMDDFCEKVLDILYRKMDNKFYFSKEKITAKSELVQRKSVKKK